MRAMNSETVDLIATDPPFNKSRDFHATPDSLAKGASFQDRWAWERDVHQEWVDQIANDHPNLMKTIESARHAHSDGMGAFMCFMAVRLLEMRRLLKSTGSIYLHCDPTASHYLKAVMDAVFDPKNFRNEIVWWYKNASRGKKQWAKSHDILLWYSKSNRFLFDRESVLVPFESGMTEWRYRRGGQSGKPMPKGKTPDDVILMPALNAMDGERTGYPTQKPLALYKRIITASSKKGDVILDPFAGCATTCVAAETLKPKRKWVGIDIWKDAKDVVLDRFEREGVIDPDIGPQGQGHLFPEDLHFTSTLPVRNDGGEIAAPYLKPRKRVRQEPPGPRMSRDEMYDILLSEHGIKCQGCDRKFDDKRYLELDHNTPRSDGGVNHISNRILLCSPCNRAKSNTLTLSGLRKLNREKGWMAP